MTIAVTVVLLIAALPVVIGYLMPIRYEGRTVVEFDQAQQQVWDALQDVAEHPMTGAT